jgi:hypothetical protein
MSSDATTTSIQITRTKLIAEVCRLLVSASPNQLILRNACKVIHCHPTLYFNVLFINLCHKDALLLNGI